MKKHIYLIFYLAMTITGNCFAAHISRNDEHARFLDKESYKKLLTETSGHFYGIGIELAPHKADAKPIIKNMIPTGPAAKAGLRKCDRILSINGTETDKLTLEECITELRSSDNTLPLSLEIARTKNDTISTLSITLTREAFPEECCWSTWLESDTILYVIIARFTKQTPLQLKEILTHARSKKLKGIIIDLRDNCGGVLQAAVDCAGFFLPKNSKVVTTKKKSGVVLHEYRTRGEPLIKNVPLGILINENTASSAEVMAQSLRIHAKVRQVFTLGTASYGKSSVQQIKPMGDGCALQSTIGFYYFSDNSTPESVGIKPDFEIPETNNTLTKDELKRCNDPRLAYLAQDNQVQEACKIFKK